MLHLCNIAGHFQGLSWGAGPVLGAGVFVLGPFLGCAGSVADSVLGSGVSVLGPFLGCAGSVAGSVFGCWGVSAGSFLGVCWVSCWS